MEFRVLGPIEVVVHDEVVHVGSPTQRTLLALLLVHPNEVVPTDRILDVLWPDDRSQARRKLWFHVCRLRALLAGVADRSAAAGVLVTRPTGYELQVDSAALDAARFEHLVRAARSSLGDDPARAGELLRQALHLWRGEPFEDVAHGDAFAPVVTRLDELRRTAVEDRIESDLALGRADDLLPELEVLVAEQPFREHLRGQLMRALYRSGRQVDALAAFRTARRTLVEELGVEPGDALTELHRQILQHDPALVPSRPAAAPSSAPREERKLVSVLHVQLVDPSASARSHDPEEVRDHLRPYHDCIRSELERFGGSLEIVLGDTVVAHFGVPVVHEDDPERAVRTAIAVRDRLDGASASVRTRSAVATGAALVTLGAPPAAREPTAVGEVVRAAARLLAVAPLGCVLVDEQTLLRTERAVEYRTQALDPDAAPGSDGAWEAVGVLARHGAHPAPSTLFVGREQELDLLQERLALARTRRAPQLVTLLGAPGMGKSRLVAELQLRTGTSGVPVTWRQGVSLPYGDGVSFWAFEEIVKAEAGVLESDPAQTVQRKLADVVHRLVDDADERRRTVRHLAALVGIGDGPQPSSRDETFAAWRHFLGALAAERPLVLVFEDLHWADEALLDFVDDVVDRSRSVPLLVVATGRPELLERRPRWGSGPSAVTTTLSPLTDVCSAQLIDALLGASVVPAHAHGALLGRMGGNPLYAEQFCRRLLEHGRLEGLPGSVQGIIAARIDRLSDPQKQLLQDAAVVGRVFWVGALEALGGLRRGAASLLPALVRADFVERAQHSSVAGDTEYTFRHELVREVAYEEIPRAGRGERHRRAAEWIDALGRPEDHAELLAHHYLAALEEGGGTGADVVEQAVSALHRAGRRAVRLSANQQAVEHFSRAVTLVDRLPHGDARSRTEAELQLQLGVALFAQRGLGAPEVERAYTRATDLMVGSAPDAEQFPAQFGLSLYHGHRGDFVRSMRLVERLEQLAAAGDEVMRLQSLHARWMNCLWAGRVDDAVGAADEGRARYQAAAHHAQSYLYGNHDPGVCASALQALAFAFRGEPARAVSRMHEAIALAESLGHAATLAQPLTQLPWVLQVNGDAEAALTASERALALEREVVHPQFFGIARAVRGWALAFLGHAEEGAQELGRALADELQASDMWSVVIGTLLAEVHLQRARPGAAREVLDRVRSLDRPMSSCFYRPELLRVEAEWLLVHRRDDDARRLLECAVSLAREHGSWAFAHRSGLVLARPGLARGDEERRQLAELRAHLPSGAGGQDDVE